MEIKEGAVGQRARRDVCSINRQTTPCKTTHARRPRTLAFRRQNARAEAEHWVAVRPNELIAYNSTHADRFEPEGSPSGLARAMWNGRAEHALREVSAWKGGGGVDPSSFPRASAHRQ